MRRLLGAVVAVLALSACAGADSVATVDGVTFDLDDIPIETEASTVDITTFRNALNWVIRDQVLTAAASDEFGVSFDSAETSARASEALAGLSETDQLDPRANLDYFLIQARVGRDGLLWPQIESRLPAGVTQNEWAIQQLAAAEVEVDVRYGEWRTNPEPLVYAP